jgi:hypothetical protein
MIDLKCKIIEQESDFKRVVMCFWLVEDRVCLESYAVEERASKRRPWVNTAFWSRRCSHESTFKRPPEIPKATKDKAVELIRNQIKYRLE